MFQMVPYAKRTRDSQYQQLLRLILDRGKRQEKTVQGGGCYSYFAPPPLRFDLQNGAPLITERKISFWRKAIGEIFGFSNGAHTIEELKSFGCDYWDQWATKEICDSFGWPVGELGPGSYGPALHDFPTPDGGHFNQIDHLIRQIKEKPWLRTHLMTTWIPFYTADDSQATRQVFAAPCHGTVIHFHIVDEVIDLHMVQRSADVPIGLPSNLIQYAALLLAVAQVTNLVPGEFIHTLSDAHIYFNQKEAVEEMLAREPRRLPTLAIKPESRNILNIFDFRASDFEVTDYDPHTPMKGIPVLI